MCNLFSKEVSYKQYSIKIINIAYYLLNMNKKVAKATRVRLSIFGTLSMISIIYFCVTFSYHGYMIYDLKKQKHKLETSYEQLQKDAEDLEIEIKKLNDKDYLARYAREKYSYSKEGEYIIKVNKTINDINTIDKQMKYNYLFIGFSCAIALIFIYIIIKVIRR